MGVCLLKSANRITAYISYPIELKLRRMILDISSHNCSQPDFSILPSGPLGTRLLKSSNQFTAYSSHPID